MSMVFCRGCGKEIHDTTPLCPQCGETQANTDVSHSDREHPGWMAIVAIVVAAFALLASFGLADEATKEQILGTAIIAIGAIVLSIINLHQKRPGKSIAIISLVLGSIVLLICIGTAS